MEPVTRTLRHVLGRIRFGLYALSEERERSHPLGASEGWPVPGIDPERILQEEKLLHDLAPGRMVRFSDLSLSFPRLPKIKNLALLPVGEGDGKRGMLFLHGGSGAGFWKWSNKDWKTLTDYLDAYLRHLELTQAFDSLRGFHDVLLSALPLGVFAIDKMGRVTYLSPPAEAILGYRRAEAIGADYLQIFRPSGTEENPVLQGMRGRAKTVELYITDRQGREKPVWMQMTPIPGRPGEDPRGMIILLRDTSDDRAFDEDQRHRDRLASIGELSAGVAHEIRNPLTGIANCAQVLRDRMDSADPSLRFVGIILDEASRLNRIVESLLAFSRPGRPVLRESSIVETIRRVLGFDEETRSKQGITTELMIGSRIPKIYIDTEQITQVMLNLIRNAVEAMPSGGRLAVSCSIVRRRPHRRRGTGQRTTDRIRYDRGAPLKRFVQIQISDSGRGIPKGVLSRVFDPFFTTRTKGTGLGLSISQSIIKEHGGFISVRSIEEKGATVSIDLPVERREGDRRRARSA